MFIDDLLVHRGLQTHTHNLRDALKSNTSYWTSYWCMMHWLYINIHAGDHNNGQNISIEVQSHGSVTFE